MRAILFSTLYFLASAVLILLSTFYFLFSDVHATGIRLYFSGPPEVATNSEFQIKLLVDSDLPLNAYDINLSFNVDLIELINSAQPINVGGGPIIDIWQNQPVATSLGNIKFSGGSTKPFSGENGELLVITFRAKKEGGVKIAFSNTAVFLANGKGTKVTPSFGEIAIKIGSAVASAATLNTTDDMAPEIQTLSVEEDPFNKNQKLVGFIVDDPSGIKGVSVRSREFLFWNDWQPARNPTAVPRGTWATEVQVTDNAGNITKKTIYDWGVFARLAAIVGAIIAAIVLGMFYYLRRRASITTSDVVR